MYIIIDYHYDHTIPAVQNAISIHCVRAFRHEACSMYHCKLMNLHVHNLHSIRIISRKMYINNINVFYKIKKKNYLKLIIIIIKECIFS